jgi:hypothetical protein
VYVYIIIITEGKNGLINCLTAKKKKRKREKKKERDEHRGKRWQDIQELNSSRRSAPSLTLLAITKAGNTERRSARHSQSTAG